MANQWSNLPSPSGRPQDAQSRRGTTRSSIGWLTHTQAALKAREAALKKSIMTTGASIALLAATLACVMSPGLANARGGAGGFHRGGHLGSLQTLGHFGEIGSLHRLRDHGHGRGRSGKRFGSYGGWTPYAAAQTDLALGLEASLENGYADYYADYDGLPLVSPDHGYPTAFEDGKWPSDISAPDTRRY